MEQPAAGRSSVSGDIMTASGDTKRLPLALLTFVAWVLATLYSMKWADDGTKKPLVDTVTHGISWNLAIAVAVLALATFIWRWRDLGFVRPDIAKSIRLAWFPLIYLALFLAMALFFGLPPLSTLVFLAINTALVGISEEWMFRGVLLQGLRSRFSIWPAIILSCLLSCTVGFWHIPGLGRRRQSRCRAPGRRRDHVPRAVLPNFLYALYLLRNVRNDRALAAA
jgi:membrane protease YdiL (CAAX protease family)